jgi:hypothetical protein
MTLLDDGSVLITGGISEREQPLGRAEILSPDGLEAATIPSGHAPRAAHSCVKLEDGRVLLAGGVGPNQTPEPKVELFDPQTKSFTAAGQLEKPGIFSEAVLLADGKVLVCGGTDGAGAAYNTVELFDPAAGRSSPASPMIHRRYQHRAVPLGPDSILITGGAGDAESRRTAEIFDVKTKTFTLAGRMHIDRVIHTSTVLADGRVFTFSNNAGEIFDPAARQFSLAPGAAPPNIRDEHTATLLEDGSVLIVGGGMPEFSEDVLGAPVLFHPLTNTYTDLNLYNELVNRAGHAAVRLRNGQVLLTGGRTVHKQATNAIVLYDPRSRQFR